jgi:hypothetical protein
MYYKTKSVQELVSLYDINWDELDAAKQNEWLVEFELNPNVVWETWARHHLRKNGYKQDQYIYVDVLVIGKVYLCFQTKEKSWYWIKYLGDRKWTAGAGISGKTAEKYEASYSKNEDACVPVLMFTNDHLVCTANELSKEFRLPNFVEKQEKQVTYFTKSYPNLKPEKKIRYLNKTSESV